MKNIDDFNLPYRMGRIYVNFSFKNYYDNYVVLGKENIPSKGPVIFAPNHLNALMDPLAILSSVPFNLPVVFIARSDIFSNNFTKKALRFLKILPAFRIRDGIENLGKNQEVFDTVVDILERESTMCIMPEGNQGEERKLRPIVKGIFRIAFADQLKYKSTPHLKIIPVGLDYSNFINYGEDIIINFGKAIEVADYMKMYEESPPAATNQIRAKLHESLHEQTVDIASQENYDVLEELVWFLNMDMLIHKKLDNKIENRFRTRQDLANTLIDIEKNEPEKLNAIVEFYNTIKYGLKKHKLKPDCLDLEKSNAELLSNPLILLLSLPVFLGGALLNFIPFFGCVGIRKLIGVKKKGFYSSVYFFISIFLFPISYILQTLLFWIVIPNSLWWTVPIFLLSQLYLGKFAFRWYKGIRKCLYRISYKWKKRKQKAEINTYKKIKDEIFNLIIE